MLYHCVVQCHPLAFTVCIGAFLLLKICFSLIQSRHPIDGMKYVIHCSNTKEIVCELANPSS